MTVDNVTVTGYISRMNQADLRYGIKELAELGGVSRRTVRYYTQEKLLPPPLGVGRGRHYGRQHLGALLKVKSLQEAGQTLEEIRRTLSGKQPDILAAPSAAQLERLAALCRVHVGPTGEPEHGDE